MAQNKNPELVANLAVDFLRRTEFNNFYSYFFNNAFPFCVLQRTTNFNTTGGFTYEDLPWSSQVQDPHGMWSSGSQIDLVRPGFYVFFGAVRWGSGTGDRRVMIKINDTTDVIEFRNDGQTQEWGQPFIGAYLTTSSSDYAEIRVASQAAATIVGVGIRTRVFVVGFPYDTSK